MGSDGAHSGQDRTSTAQRRRVQCSGAAAGTANEAGVVAVDDEAWSDAGLDKSQKQLALSMPVTLTIGTQTFGGEATVQYQNKTGKAGVLKKMR